MSATLAGDVAGSRAQPLWALPSVGPLLDPGSILTCNSQVKCEYCSQVEWPRHDSQIILKSAPKVEINGLRDIQGNRISELRACCHAWSELANASAIQKPVSQHGRA